MAALLIIIVGLVCTAVGFVLGHATGAGRHARGSSAAVAAGTWQVYVRGGAQKNVTSVSILRLRPGQKPETVQTGDFIILGGVPDDAKDYLPRIETLRAEAQARARALNAALDTTPGSLR